MPQMTTAQARVIDPILSSIARGDRQPGLIASRLFPRVPVAQRAGRIIQFGAEDFMLYNTARAPGSTTKRVTFGHKGLPYVLESHSLEGLVPIELLDEASAVPGIDLAANAVRKTQAIINLRLEKASADLLRNASLYPTGNKVTLSGSSQWSDYSGTSDPIADVEAGKEGVRAKIGIRANTVALSAAAFAKVKQHPKIVERIKYTSRDVATPEILAALFGVDEVLIGDAVFSTVSDAFNPVFADVWGKDAWVGYVEPESMAAQGSPNFGAMYELEGYPMVEEAYYERPEKSWVYPVTDEVQPVISGAVAGYLITNAVN